MSRAYPDRPFVGVGAIVFRGDHVLLIKRGNPPRQGEWSIPGGIQRIGETVNDALCREVREETGLIVDVIEVVAVVDSIFRDGAQRVKYHYTLIDLLAEWRSGEAVPGDDAAACTWTALDQLGEFHLWHETERVIRLAAERRAMAGRMTPVGTSSA